MHDVSTIDPRDLDSVEELQAYCDDQAAAILEWCRERDVKIACAESLTGGLLADAFVRIPGASQVFLGSAVTYDIHAKVSVLGVNAELLRREGAVHPQVAIEMAQRTAQLFSQSDYPPPGWLDRGLTAENPQDWSISACLFLKFLRSP